MLGTLLAPDVQIRSFIIMIVAWAAFVVIPYIILSLDVELIYFRITNRRISTIQQ